jgi:hypothetical protein
LPLENDEIQLLFTLPCFGPSDDFDNRHGKTMLGIIKFHIFYVVGKMEKRGFVGAIYMIGGVLPKMSGTSTHVCL